MLTNEPKKNLPILLLTIDELAVVNGGKDSNQFSMLKLIETILSAFKQLITIMQKDSQKDLSFYE